MRKSIQWNNQWQFVKGSSHEVDQWENVTLPHTWNALDGQDGGADYYQGPCWYRKTFAADPAWKQVYVRIGAASKSAVVLCNGQEAASHKGGFSAFTVDLTPYLTEGENELLVCVSNANDQPIYPRNADFTFFGGLYRGAELICFDTEKHFDVTTCGTDALFITPHPDGRVQVSAWAADGETVRFTIRDAAGVVAATAEAVCCDENVQAEMKVETPVLWDGVDAPALYTCTAAMDGDEVCSTFGFRSYRVDPEKGFFLNGRSYPLHGVCRHQDRENMGWAITAKEHEEDMALVREIGANTMRLAHYQQSPYFYDLCDRNGLVIWAEIPFISAYQDSREADENLRTQLFELIMQNYNHPSICFWGLANELGIGGESPNMIAMLRELNAKAKNLDPTRLTVIANVSMTQPESDQFHIADVASYNEYMGWYEGTADDHGAFCDARHARMPQVPMAISEYGADCLVKWHSAEPKCKDYTEEYQALVHEKAYADFEARPWIWATWLWNMFDFAADGRDEGGCKGRNNKGIVTYDRKTKKEAFYFYKAKWSKEPFVYLCGKRFTKRHEDAIDVKVYSNAGEVTLTVNGGTVGSLKGEAVFCFAKVPLTQPSNTLVVTASNGQTDSVVIEKVAEKPAEYTFVEQKAFSANVAQWFAGQTPAVRELEIREGFLSVDDPLEVVYSYPEGARAVKETIQAPLSIDHPAMAARLDVGGALSFASVWHHISKMLPDDALYILNDRLNKIPK